MLSPTERRWGIWETKQLVTEGAAYLPARAHVRRARMIKGAGRSKYFSKQRNEDSETKRQCNDY